MSKYLKWSEVERTSLLNFVLGGIEKGNSASSMCRDFASMYNIPVSSVSAQWNKVIAPENKLAVIFAKNKWLTVGKPEKEAKIKAEKEAKRREFANKKFRAKYFAQAKKPNKVSVAHKSNKPMNPKHKGLIITVDSNGVVNLKS